MGEYDNPHLINSFLIRWGIRLNFYTYMLYLSSNAMTLLLSKKNDATALI